MKVAIVGDGVAGRTLAWLLKETGLEVKLFGKKHRNACGIRGCGFGTSGSCIQLLGRLNLNPVNFILRYDRFVLMDGRKVRGDLYAIDKPKLLKVLASDIIYEQPNLSNYNLVVDATGLSRQLLPSAANDKLARNYQYRVLTRGKVFPAFDLIRGGYLWTIPLGDREAHIGGGSTQLPLKKIKELVEERVRGYKGEVVCSCFEPIRLSGLIPPLITNNIVAVGEASGTVVPFGGGGIHSSIESALILAECIVRDKLENYNRVMKVKFGWLRKARRIIDNLDDGRVSLWSLPAAYRALRYQGFKPTIADLLHIRRKLIETNRE